MKKTQLNIGLMIAGITVVTQAHAADFKGITVQPSARGNAPTVSVSTKNNVPVINIAAPTYTGDTTAHVSKNYFIDYQVPAQGIILNNTSAGTNTTLGGAIKGNERLVGKRSADLIVVQITGQKASTIAGSHEVAGRAANLVIANPYGIAVNGRAPVRFINSPQVTLTTGIPSYNILGNIATYRVDVGVISVAGKGIDSRANSRLMLISHTAKIAADIRADGQRLDVVTGKNTVQNDLKAITVNSGDLRGQAYAIDVSALGGMFAGQMNLIATTQGVGVNNNGYIALSKSALGNAATLRINLNGQLINNGVISGGKNSTLNKRFGVTSAGTGSVDVSHEMIPPVVDECHKSPIAKPSLLCL